MARRREQQYEQELLNLKQKLEEELQEERQQYIQLEQEKREIESKFEKMKEALEEDVDGEIDELKEVFEKKHLLEQAEEKKYLDDSFGLDSDLRTKTNTIETLKADIARKHAEEQKQYELIHSFEKDIEGYKKEINEKEATVQDKRKRIYDLKKKNQELEKFKFVLNYKIGELKRQIDPKQEDINSMNQQMTEMQTELNEYKKENEALKLEVKRWEWKVRGLEVESETQKTANEKINQEYQACQRDMREVMQSIDDIKALKVSLKKLYQRYVTGDLRGEVDTDMHQEYQRRRYFLEKNIDSLKRKLEKDAEVHKKENKRIVQENVALIREINELRKELYLLHEQQRAKSADESRRPRSRASPINQLNRTAHLDQLYREIEIQREQIHALQQQLEVLQRGLAAATTSSDGSLMPPHHLIN
eukprot:TRINITY_DN12691_c0_g1_i7.p1 TRINITY_DN12691_c0_g1~~TRINITY_DN12691_c0_g1_i7.p1  ORF type:complete len:419 (+),score=95.25 TRINITY_DN12691_c0_g1_i7:55-1311(+)